jgi:hypothetical protein
MEYRLKRSGEACGGCSAEFPVGQSMFSVLELAAEQPLRADYCDACFDKLRGEGRDIYAFWKTKKTSEGRSRRVVDYPSLRELFFRMAQIDAVEYRKLAYLMALILVRKRFLAIKEFVTQGGVDYLIITAKDRPDALRIEAPELRAPEIADLTGRLRLLLDMDLEEVAPQSGGGAASARTPAEGAADGAEPGAESRS